MSDGEHLKVGANKVYPLKNLLFSLDFSRENSYLIFCQPPVLNAIIIVGVSKQSG